MQAARRFSATLQPWFRKSGRQAILIGVVLVLGVFARTWEYGHLPPGLNADEASIGVEAYDLAHFGVDRNGVSYPVHFIAWGSGQNALYGYILIPFVAALGLSSVRGPPAYAAGWDRLHADPLLRGQRRHSAVELACWRCFSSP